ncbi:AlkA N-terminal domain-containing protein [Aquimonas sp.]|jgi:AraC family transcriptional regulator of adaptative response / DNA-3-methyladenine glycosylase II|uniref:DNA-3-methyladenine glycosylase 2 family protein n=1 Tax=Aquimonas sp. TaxID=1872588 RepID=UPI0037C02E85
MSTPTELPSTAICEQARLSRDARFDGLFFTAVRSTGIYCRPVCPAPAPKPANISYYPSAAAAEGAGFRPCLRCRPELSPAQGSWRRGDALLARALQLIEQGVLDSAPLATLAAQLHIGERQLRRIFVERLGAAPLGVHGTRRLLFAKQLLSETALPITEVALAAGFGSLRRFNAAFLEAYAMPPRALRKREGAAVAGDRLVLRLNYRPPFDFNGLLDFLRGRALAGIEQVDTDSYARVIGNAAQPGWLRVSRWPDTGVQANASLRLELHNVPAPALQDTVARVRRMFDLDADPAAIASAFSGDTRMAPLLTAHPGLRLPSGWDGFEIAVRAVIGQQVSVAAARTLTARLSARFGASLPDALQAQGFTQLFPTPNDLAEADLQAIGLTRARAETVRSMARALLDGRVDFSAASTLDDFVARWVALPGIGPWTAHYIALRALGHPDAFPAEDLVLQKALPIDGSRLSAAQLRARAEAWRPWRGYAVLHLWRSAMPPPATPTAAAAATPRAARASRREPRP